MAGREGESGVKIHRRSERDATGQTELPPVVIELAQAKDRLARELEENLKQLKEILKESQRISRELELVLKEAQAPTALTIPAKQADPTARGMSDGLPSPDRERWKERGHGAQETEETHQTRREGREDREGGKEHERDRQRQGSISDWFRPREGDRDQPPH